MGPCGMQTLIDMRHKRIEKMVSVAGTPAGTKAPPSLPGELGSGKPYVYRVDLRHAAVELSKVMLPAPFGPAVSLNKAEGGVERLVLGPVSPSVLRGLARLRRIPAGSHGNSVYVSPALVSSQLPSNREAELMTIDEDESIRGLNDL